MTVPGIGQIAPASVVDTTSINPTATYPATAVGPTMKVCTTIKSNNSTVNIIDRTVIPYSNVPGSPTNPIVPPVPPVLPRVSVDGIINAEERGVFFEGMLVTVIGDGIQAPGAAPNPRPLTGGSEYPTIIIGTLT